MSRERFERWILRALRVLGLLFFFVMVAFPFYWMIVSSFKSLEELLMQPSNLWLDLGKIDFGAYYEVLFEHGFLRYIANSLYVSIATVICSLVLATVGGYAVTRIPFRGRGVMSYSILVIYMFPAIVLVIPLYVVFSKMGLRDSTHVLILVYLAQGQECIYPDAYAKDKVPDEAEARRRYPSIPERPERPTRPERPERPPRGRP